MSDLPVRDPLVIPGIRQLQRAREEFSALLARSNTKEMLWQKFFAEHPYVLSTALPIRLMPQDLVPLGRQGRSEPDLIFYPRHTPRRHPSYGVIELKRSDQRILTHPRKNLVTLSANAATAVSQGKKYLLDLEQGSILQSPANTLFLGTSAYVFIVMGLSVELEKALVSELLDATYRSLLPPNFQIIPYDHLYRMFEANVPPLFMSAAPTMVVAPRAVPAGRKLGLLVSESSPVTNIVSGLPAFAGKYWPLLSQYTLLVTKRTAALLQGFGNELRSRGIDIQWQLDVYPNSHLLANKLISTDAREVERILLFHDSHKLENLKNLLEAVVECHQKLNINLGASLWAENEWKARSGVVQGSVVGSSDALVLVGQNSEPEIDRFAMKHLDKIVLFPRFILTPRIRATVADLLKAVNPDLTLSESRINGTADIAELIVTNYFDTAQSENETKTCHVIAFTQRNRNDEQRQAVQELIGICVDPRMKVNLLLNRETAEEWIEQQFELAARSNTPADSRST